ncbi:protein roadkill-like [Uloborus diversus]|uniref:protein roadkill-like n=1 Tax=Uloborus diversus TaxID=327109 RepID=UPI002409EAC2|nr:protein roadkill-like [Uloborus diversus]
MIGTDLKEAMFGLSACLLVNLPLNLHVKRANYQDAIQRKSLVQFQFVPTPHEHDNISGVREYYSFSTLSKDFEELYNNPATADVTLKIGMDEFPAHKLVLRSRSKVFQKMFEHDMQETQQDLICICEMEVNTLKDLLRYMYCGKVRELPLEEALNLYMAADRYELMELMGICRELIAIGMSTKNVCRIAEIANLCDDQLLIDIIQPFLKENLQNLVKTEEWKNFSINKPMFSLKLLECAIS